MTGIITNIKESIRRDLIYGGKGAGGRGDKKSRKKLQHHAAKLCMFVQVCMTFEGALKVKRIRRTSVSINSI